METKRDSGICPVENGESEARRSMSWTPNFARYPSATSFTPKSGVSRWLYPRFWPEIGVLLPPSWGRAQRKIQGRCDGLAPKKSAQAKPSVAGRIPGVPRLLLLVIFLLKLPSGGLGSQNTKTPGALCPDSSSLLCFYWLELPTDCAIEPQVRVLVEVIVSITDNDFLVCSELVWDTVNLQV
jgi:hypothetical protein